MRRPSIVKSSQPEQRPYCAFICRRSSRRTHWGFTCAAYKRSRDGAVVVAIISIVVGGHQLRRAWGVARFQKIRIGVEAPAALAEEELEYRQVGVSLGFFARNR